MIVAIILARIGRIGPMIWLSADDDLAPAAWAVNGAHFRALTLWTFVTVGRG
jgi:hypothetical protein